MLSKLYHKIYTKIYEVHFRYTYCRFGEMDLFDPKYMTYKSGEQARDYVGILCMVWVMCFCPIIIPGVFFCLWVGPWLENIMICYLTIMYVPYFVYLYNTAVINLYNYRESLKKQKQE